MSCAVSVFVMIDACGWDIVAPTSFLSDRVPYRTKLRSVFGYSSACVPAILSGLLPVENGHWGYFYYDPIHSPFSFLKLFSCLPKFITDRRRFRSLLSKFVCKRLGYSGYFDLYNIPFSLAHLFCYSERKSPLLPGGMNVGRNIFDVLTEKNIPFYVSDPHLDEVSNFRNLNVALNGGIIKFAFIYWPGLDGHLHTAGVSSVSPVDHLSKYEGWIHQLIDSAESNYSKVNTFVFSDHGMANCNKSLNILEVLKSIPFVSPNDYVVFCDSTMARFWFTNPLSRKPIEELLRSLSIGRIVSDVELSSLGVLFPDYRFGELIFLLPEGALIVPSHMGIKGMPAMHGYHPDCATSYAALLSSEKLELPVNCITDIYKLMVKSVG